VGALVGVGVLSACTATSPNAAVVNGTAIKQSTLLRELHALASNKEVVSAIDLSAASPASYVFGTGTASTTFTQAFAGDVLTSDIQAELLHQEVARRHIEPTPIDISNETTAVTQQFPSGVFVKLPSWLQAEYKLRAADGAALSKALSTTLNASTAVKDFFTSNPEFFISKQCVSQIIVPTRAQAVKIRADIASGARFDVEARSYSIDATSATKGGDLGCAAPTYDASSTLDAEMRAMTVNRVSDPVYIPAAPPSSAPVTPGWYLILVRSRQQESLDATNTSQIQQFFQQAPLQVFLDAAFTTAKVSVDPGYGTWDLTLDRVVAPLAPEVTAGLPSSASP
jgi:hypothetical protein